MQLKRKLPWILTGKALLAIVSITTVVLAVTLFTHTIPAINGVLSTSCTTLTANTLTAGTVLLTCAGAAPVTTNSAGSATPTFTLGTGVSAIGLVTHVASATTCTMPATGTTAPSLLTSGTAETFTASQSLDYCISVTAAPTASFTISWAQ